MDETIGFLDIGRGWQRTFKSGGFYLRLPVIERLRAARGMKQAVVKAVSYAHGLTRVKALVDYISRQGKLELETETGEQIKDREQGRALVTNWAMDFDGGSRSRDAVHLVFSMPPGSKVEALGESVRKVGARAFPDREWVFAIHEDRKHPHAHMVVKMRGREKDNKLRLNKPELYKLREVFAEAAREQGVMLAATPRAVRGVGQKGERQAINQMRRRGIIPNVEKESARTILTELKRGPLLEKPWEKAMRERNERERKAYLVEAERFIATAAQEKARNDPKLQQTLLKAAADLRRFARTMPKPKTRRQAMTEKAKTKTPEKSKGREADNGLEL